MSDAELVDLLGKAMARSGLVELDLARPDFTLRLRRELFPSPVDRPGVLPFQKNGHEATPTVVRSPVAGMFADREAGSSVPFISAGQRVGPQTIVGLVQDENGVVNEIVAKTGGTVSRVCVSDGASVEVGAVLCELSP